MNVNEKGQIGLIKVISDLTTKGYECFVPMHDYSAVDLIVLRNYIPIRLQVKYRAAVKNIIDVPFSSVVNGKKVPINKDAIDGWAIYSSDLDKVLYLPIVGITKNSFGIRLVEGNKKMARGGNTLPMWTNFLDEKELWIAGRPVMQHPAKV